MADTAKKDEKTEETKPTTPAEKPAESPETTTANDSSIAINQDAPSADVKPAEPQATPAAPKPDATEETLIQTPTAPVVVSDADVAAAEKEADPHQSLSEQIEVLTGEVQALEAKIERLTSGVGDSPITPTSTEPEKPVEIPPMAVPAPVEEVKAVEAIPEEPKVEAAPPVASQTVPVAVTSTTAVTPVNDIYEKLMTSPTQSPQAHKDLNDDTTIEEGTSGIGTIGEVLIVFGIIAFVILGASPFFKSMIGTNWEALKSIGWPTATISLALGFLLFLFNKGRLVFKIFALLLTLVAAIMTAAVFDYGSMLGPLSNLLDPIASFYK